MLIKIILLSILYDYENIRKTIIDELFVNIK